MKNANKIIETLKMNDSELDKMVHIQGTKYDRKVKFTEDDFKKARKMLKAGRSWAEISKECRIKVRDLRYHLDPVFKKEYLTSLSGKHTGKDHISKQNRVSYKRHLVAAGLLVV